MNALVLPIGPERGTIEMMGHGDHRVGQGVGRDARAGGTGAALERR